LGASSNFVRTPFILEGMFYGLTGALSSWVIIYILLWYFTPFLQGYISDIPLLPINPLFMLSLLLIGSLVALLIGGFGALGAVRRYLQI